MTDKILSADKSDFRRTIKNMVAKAGYGLMTTQFVAEITTVVFYDNRDFFKQLLKELIND